MLARSVAQYRTTLIRVKCAVKDDARMLRACSALLALALFILAALIKQIVAVACSVTSLITPAKRSTQLSAMSAVRMKIVLQLNTATQPP